MQQHPSELDDFHMYHSYRQYQIEQYNKRYSQKVYYLLIIIFVIASFYLLENASPSISFTKLLLAMLAAWVGLLPSLHYIRDPERPPIPFFPLIGIFYTVTFCLPIFLRDDVQTYGRSNLKDVTNTSLVLTLIGILGMSLGFYLSKTSIWKNIAPFRITQSFSVSRLLALLWLMLIGHIAYLCIPILHHIPSIGQLLVPLGFLCYGIFYLIWAEGKLSSTQTILLVCVCFPLDLLYAFSTGLLSNIMSLALFMIFIFWYKHQRIPVLLIVATTIFFIIFSPVKQEYRSLTWKGQQNKSSQFEKAQLFLELAIEHHTTELEFKQLEQENANLVRIAHIYTFSQVVEKTPRIVPYWNGESYLPLLTKLIPRLVWKNKPSENTGNQFGHRYGYLDFWDTSTSVNLPWLIELYANFGTLGVLFGMPFFGVFLAFIEQKFNNKQMNFIEIILGITVTSGLTYQESNFSLMVGNIFVFSAAVYLLFKFFVSVRT